MLYGGLLQGASDPRTRKTLAALVLQLGREISKAPAGPAGGAVPDVPTTGTSWLDRFEGVSDNNHRAKSYEVDRIWRNSCEEEARVRYTSPTVVDSILEIV